MSTERQRWRTPSLNIHETARVLASPWSFPSDKSERHRYLFQFLPQPSPLPLTAALHTPSTGRSQAGLWGQWLGYLAPAWVQTAVVASGTPGGPHRSPSAEEGRALITLELEVIPPPNSPITGHGAGHMDTRPTLRIPPQDRHNYACSLTLTYRQVCPELNSHPGQKLTKLSFLQATDPLPTLHTDKLWWSPPASSLPVRLQEGCPEAQSQRRPEDLAHKAGGWRPGRTAEVQGDRDQLSENCSTCIQPVATIDSASSDSVKPLVSPLA